MSNIPRHIAIIMDGNGRWASQKGYKRARGHEEGAKVVRAVTEFAAAHRDVERLTLYAFSTENWKRPKIEVDFLMKLLERYLKEELPTYLEHNIRFEPIGDLSRFSKSLLKQIAEVERKTARCDGLVQSLALNYGAKDEIVRAARSLAEKGEPIDEENLGRALDCPSDVDLLIRTGGDRRLSNYLLWQAAYAELFFTDTLWPDFTPEELERIIDDFTTIERRFGGLAQ
jgi:undecaprenyl diphosphate synthase